MSTRTPFHLSIRGLMTVVLAVGLGCFAIIEVGAFWRPRALVCRWSCQGNIRQIVLALDGYHHDHGCFPPAYVADAHGRPLYSWRVLILPYMDQQDIYNSFNLAQRWDVPDNIASARINIRDFRCPRSEFPANAAVTDFVAITGQGTLFPGGRRTSSSDVLDPAPSTLGVVEYAGPIIHWAEPRDLDVGRIPSSRVSDPSLGRLSDRHDDGSRAAFLDGSVRCLPSNVTPAEIRALATIQGGEVIDAASLGR